jgi:sulfatase modifying factor 1
MGRPRALLLAALACAALTGCDEEQPVFSFGAARKAEDKKEKAKPKPEAPSKDKKRAKKGKSSDPLAGAGSAGSGEGDGGRVLFDGDKARPEGDFSVGGAGGDNSYKKGNVNAQPKANTLKVSEPPTPKGSPVAGLHAQHAKTGDVPKPGAVCPPGMAHIENFCVDYFEASLVETGGGAWSPYLVLDAGKSYKAVSSQGAVPQGYISADQAKSACANAGKRLCKPAEWDKACRGPQNTQYPYGKDFESARCNEHDKDASYTSTILRVFKGDQSVFSDFKKMNDPRINQQPNGLLASGAKARCFNGWGLYDMVGNLHEWIDDPAGTFRGGYYSDTYRNGSGCAYKTTAHPSNYHDYSTGFRCCADPK